MPLGSIRLRNRLRDDLLPDRRVQAAVVGKTSAIRLLPEDPAQAGIAISASIVGCTLAIVVVDATFRSSLTRDYLSTFAGPAWAPTPLMVLRAAIDELIGRLILVGGMLTLVGVLTRGRNVGAAALFCIFVIAQVVLLLPQLSAPVSVQEATYDSLRFVGPGVLWGWLFWRHGLAAALLGHAGTHPVLDPALHLLLSRANG